MEQARMPYGRLTAAGMLWLMAAGAFAAPAPLPPREQQLHMVGVWRKWWSRNEQTYVCVFRPGDRYEAHLGDHTFRGTWRVKGRTLHVEESCGGNRLKWSVTLGTDMTGTTDTGVAVRFERAEL